MQLAFALMYSHRHAHRAAVCCSGSAINFSKWLVSPIRRLMWAADRVAAGNLDVQVPVHKSEGDLATLGETFNNMTSELKGQRNDIVRARDQMDSRRRFTEAVLAGVGAGVIGLDADERVTILNRSAERLLGLSEAEALGRQLAEVVPETASLITEAEHAGQRIIQGNITLQRDGRERVFAMRVTTEQVAGGRGSRLGGDAGTTSPPWSRPSVPPPGPTWPRRIAHEIKNPLTPHPALRGAARSASTAATSPRTATCSTSAPTPSIRQVGDIGRMVDEFSFLRPHAQARKWMRRTSRRPCARAVFLMRVGHPDVDLRDRAAALACRRASTGA